MNNLLAFSNVLQISGVTAVLFGAFLITALGYLVGSIKIKGVSLGTAGVFLVAIAFGIIFAIPGLVKIDFLNNFYLIGDSDVYEKLVAENLLDKVMLKTLSSSHSNTEVYGTLADVGLILFVTSGLFLYVKTTSSVVSLFRWMVVDTLSSV